jgi:hypothetical protein
LLKNPKYTFHTIKSSLKLAYETGTAMNACKSELENMSIYEILPALDLTQSVHAKISIGMHRGVKLKISRIPLIGLETRLG